MDAVVLGKVVGLYGIKGWLKVFSHTRPREQLIQYNPLYLHYQGQWRSCVVESARQQGKNLLVKLGECDDRDQAMAYLHGSIAVDREQLPVLEEGEYYWRDLEGLAVVTVSGQDLGKVDHLFETGANDVLVVQGERQRLIPLIFDQVVRQVDLRAGRMIVDWDPEF